MSMKTKLTIAIMMLSLTSFAIANESTLLLKDAISLIDNNEPEKAVSLLEDRVEDFAGESQFDYILGKAAFDSGKENLAVFALERSVLVSPGKEDSRYLLAKAYDKLGENNQALVHFNYIVQNSKNRQYVNASQNYLKSIYKRNSLTHDTFITAGFGKDSNANSAPETDQFLGLNLTSLSKSTSSTMSIAQLTDHLRYPLTKSMTLFSTTTLFKYDYSDAEFINTLGGAIDSGFNYNFNKILSNRVSLSYRHIEVDDKLNSRSAAASYYLQYKSSKSSVIGASVSGGRTDFVPEYSIRDIDQYNTGLFYTQGITLKKAMLVTTRFFLSSGKETAVHSNPQYNRLTNAIYAAASIPVKSTQNLFEIKAALKFSDSNYDSPFFGISRRDKNYSAALKLNAKISRYWSIEPSINFIKNSSSVDLYDFTRTQTSIVLSHQII